MQMLKAADRGIANQSMLFASLPENLAEPLLERATVSSCDRGTTIFLQG